MAQKHGAEKGKWGQTAHEPTPQLRELARTLSGLGVPQPDIAKLMDLGSDATLRKYYSAELSRGQAEANAKIAQSLFQQAINGNVAAAIYWTKARMGWREVQVNEHHIYAHVESLSTVELDRLIAVEIANREETAEDDRAELQ